MTHQKREFIRFPVDSDRVIANLDAAYGQWIDARQRLEAMPSSMFWQRKGDVDYLAVKEQSAGSATTVGLRSPSTESEHDAFHTEKNALRDSIKTADELIAQRAAQYRALRLPVLGDKQAELLRALDVEGLLRNDLLVVGTNAFSAYEILCGAKFPVGNEETEDFDLAWCRDSGVSVSRAPINPSQTNHPKRRSLLTVLQRIDATYKINPRKPYQAVNAAGYEVELLAAPSLSPLPANEAFKPMVTLIEQEWLLKGRPVSFVISTVRQRACPMFVPDPRWMAMHKLWLSQKLERNPTKKPKDRRQGLVLLDACRYFLADSYPLDIDFVLALPPELRDVFNEWATNSGFNPMAPEA
jgi:hypothetical protein